MRLPGFVEYISSSGNAARYDTGRAVMSATPFTIGATWALTRLVS